MGPDPKSGRSLTSARFRQPKLRGRRGGGRFVIEKFIAHPRAGFPTVLFVVFNCVDNPFAMVFTFQLIGPCLLFAGWKKKSFWFRVVIKKPFLHGRIEIAMYGAAGPWTDFKYIYFDMRFSFIRLKYNSQFWTKTNPCQI